MAEKPQHRNIDRQNSLELFDEDFSVDRNINEILRNSFRTFLNNFILAYGIRTGISVLLR